MKIMFMGTESFALEALKALYEAKKDEAEISVVTQTDKPRGRGHKVVFDCVKEFALDKGLRLYQPENLRAENFREILEKEDPRLIVVASYGKILPEYVLSYPECGCVCVHASLLPGYRGAAPINRVIMEGEKVTGVTLMYMDKGIDTGNIICKGEMVIGDRNAGELREELAALGGALLKENLDRLSKGIVESEAQDDSLSCYAAKITSEDRPIVFSKSVKEVLGKIRGLSPAPGATCKVASSGLGLKILDAEIGENLPLPEAEWGELVRAAGMKKNSLGVRCADGILLLKLIQPEGGKAMDAASLINGRKLCYPDKLI